MLNLTRIHRGIAHESQFQGPGIIRRSFEMLLEENVQTIVDIRNALPFPLEDLEEIADLEPGTLGAPVQARAEPVLKTGVRTVSGNVVRLFEKKS